MKKIFLLLLLAVLIAGGCENIPFAGGDASEDRLKGLEEKMEELERLSRLQEVELFFLKETETDFLLAVELRQTEAQAEELPRQVVQGLLAGPTEEGLREVLPEGVQLLSVDVSEGIARVDFTSEIRDLTVGAQGELVLVYSIVNSLARLPGIEAVQILVQGEEVESLAGHVSVAEPLLPDEEIIYPRGEK